MNLKEFNSQHRSALRRDKKSLLSRLFFVDEPAKPLGAEKLIIILTLWVPTFVTAAFELSSEGLEYFRKLATGELMALVPISEFALAFAITSLILQMHHENHRRARHDKAMRARTAKALRQYFDVTDGKIRESFQTLLAEQARFNAEFCGIVRNEVQNHRSEQTRFIMEQQKLLRDDMNAWVESCMSLLDKQGQINAQKMLDFVERFHEAEMIQRGRDTETIRTAFEAAVQAITLQTLQALEELRMALIDKNDQQQKAQRDIERAVEARMAEVLDRVESMEKTVANEMREAATYYMKSISANKREHAEALDDIRGVFAKIDNSVGTANSGIRQILSARALTTVGHFDPNQRTLPTRSTGNGP